MINKYIKKPVPIEAIQLKEDNIFQVISFIEGKETDFNSSMTASKWEFYVDSLVAGRGLVIKTSEGGNIANFGDYIIKGINGDFYPCRPDIFKHTYYTQEEYANLN